MAQVTIGGGITLSGEICTNDMNVLVTPEIAKELLEHNHPNNRLIRRRHVTEIAKDMKAGKYSYCTDPIAFDPDGNMLNGQHRLRAVIESGTPVWMKVERDVPPETIFDKNSKRSTGDIVCMSYGVAKPKSTTHITALAKRYLAIRDTREASTITDGEVADLILKYGDKLTRAIDISCKYKHGGGNRTAVCVRAPVHVAIFAAMLSNVPEETLEAFARVANTGLPKGEAEYAAVTFGKWVEREYLYYGRNAANACCAYAEMAIRDFVKGTPRSTKYKTLTHVYINGKEEAWPRSKQAQ